MGIYYSRCSNSLRTIINMITIMLFMVTLGTRIEVGADWFNYINLYELDKWDPSFFTRVEFGYKAINVFSYNYFDSYLAVIFISTFILIFFSILGCVLCGVNPYYFLVLTGPFHIVMSGMNYNRQALALSLIVIVVGLVFIYKKKSAIVVTFIAVTFHTSAILLLPLPFYKTRLRFLLPISIALIAGISYQLYLEYRTLYLDSSHYQSSGIILRLAYCILINLMLLKQVYKGIVVSQDNKRLIYISSLFVLAISMIAALSTTAADRIAYYSIIFSTLIWLKNWGVFSRLERIIPFFYSMTCFAVWAIYSHHAVLYHYRSYIFE